MQTNTQGQEVTLSAFAEYNQEQQVKRSNSHRDNDRSDSQSQNIKSSRTKDTEYFDHSKTHNRRRAKQFNSITRNNQTNPGYRCDISLIPRDTHYRPPLPALPSELPMTFSARIESDGKYATLDTQGRYRLRKLLDLGDSEHTQAINPPLRMMQPYAGPMQQYASDAEGNTLRSLPTGMHFPLQDGDEVLLSCLNGDPDRPMIVGSHYDAAHHSPVTNVNPSENRLRTKADNELIMDDKVDHEIIKLRTYEGYNILQFDAKKAEHMLRLASEQGAMHRYAKQTYHHKSGDTHEERVGNDRIQVVENKSFTQTKNKDIHHQTPTDLLQNAGTNIIHEANDNIEITAKENQVIVVEDENMEITVEGPGGMRVHIKNDALHIQSAKETRIEGNGGGDITLHQSGGGVCVTAGGNIKLFGNDIQIEGDNGVSLNGTVRYTIGSGVVPAPIVDPALQVQVFALIKAAIMGKPFVKICEEMSSPAITAYDLN
ncbi:hypothetical protein MNBD_GAMMA12-2205 [hydrothermal vent metagenome]|uniref:VgrG protein n=1 Tax=hydrothermal vent metagenome TaxID=652676 RepID=A0A3B0YRK2_9ZZZZ